MRRMFSRKRRFHGENEKEDENEEEEDEEESVEFSPNQFRLRLEWSACPFMKLKTR